MKLVVFGLTLSSSWGNGHATLWRALCRALAGRGHRIVFFEHDTPYYAAHRDAVDIPATELRLYRTWAEVLPSARGELADADAAIVTSYCPDGPAACQLVLESPVSVKAFYDLDTPVTLERLARGERVEYLPDTGLGAFDLVLSYTGGGALDALQHRLGARFVRPLYGSVDPELHRPERGDRWAALSYLGTYAADRQDMLETLLLEPARRRPSTRFVIGGALYPASFAWPANVWYVHHVPPAAHPRFYATARLTLNVTRRAMADMGSCPSGRLFEAAACGVPILSDGWQGLDTFFRPGSEILVASSAEQALEHLDRSDDELARIAAAARARALSDHTAIARAADLEAAIEAAHQPAAVEAVRARSSAAGASE